MRNEECDSTFETRSILRIHMSLNGDTHEQNNVQGLVRNVHIRLKHVISGAIGCVKCNETL